MVASVEIDEYNGAEAVTHNITNVNFGNTDATSLTTSNFPITAGICSFTKYLRIHWTSGTANKLDNFQVWLNTGSGFVTGETITSNLTTSGYSSVSFATPVTTSYAGTGNIATAAPGTQNIGVGANGLTGTLSAVGSTDYIKLQMQTTVSTPAGDVNSKTFYFQYDEQ